MAKIVIIAPAEARSDVDDAAKMLRGNGHDVDIEDPVPKSLLHIVLGLLGPNAYGFGPGYAYAPGPDADAADGGDDETAIENPITSDADAPADDIDGLEDVEVPGDDDFNFEGFEVDGQAVKAVLTEEHEHSALAVQDLDVGPKTTYRLNESTFSFWPADQSKPVQRVDVHHENVRTSLEVEIVKEENVAEPTLFIGKDLMEILTIKKPAKLYDVLNDIANGADEVTYGGKTYRRTAPKNSTAPAGKWKLVPAKK